jgi:glutamine synthetase adenylyltransferase
LLLNPSILLEKKDQNILNSINILENISDDKIDFQSLHQNFRFLKNMQLSIQNIFDTKNAIMPLDEKKLFKLSQVLGFGNSKLLQLKLNDVTLQVNKTFQNIFR